MPLFFVSVPGQILDSEGVAGGIQWLIQELRRSRDACDVLSEDVQMAKQHSRFCFVALCLRCFVCIFCLLAMCFGIFLCSCMPLCLVQVCDCDV